jgi:toxin ParE1/3/4
MKTRWTRPALQDLDNIHVFIAQENPAAARKVGLSIKASTERLGSHSYSERAGPVPGTYELVVPNLPCVIAYRVTGSMEILAIRHDAQQSWNGQA